MRVPLALFFFFFFYVCLFGHVCFYNRGRKKKKKKRTFFSFLLFSLDSSGRALTLQTQGTQKERYKTRGRKEEEETSFVGFTSRLCSSTPSLIVYLFSFYLKREEERRTKKEEREKINRFIVSKHKIRHRNEKIRKCRIGKTPKRSILQTFNSSLPSCVCVCRER